MIGLGTQDSLGLAEQFRSELGVESFPLLWDPSFDSWRYFGVQGQPFAMLFGADGEPLGNWVILDESAEEEILALV